MTDFADIEFAISQYLDGSLAEAERSALEARLRTDAEAKALFTEYQAVTAALRAIPIPPVRWELLAESISGAVRRAEEPAQSFKLRLRGPWLAVPLGLAASVVVAAGVAFHVYFSGTGGTTSPVRPVPAVPQAVAVVTGPRVEDAAGPAQAEVSIGPSPAVADAEHLSKYADDVITRPSRVLVASGVNSVEDAPAFAN